MRPSPCGAEMWGRVWSSCISQLRGARRKWGPLLAWALLWPGSRVWGRACGHYTLTPTWLQALISNPQCPRERAGPRASGQWWERGRPARSGLWDQLLPFGAGAQPSAEARMRGRQRGSGVTVQRRAGTSQGPGQLLGQHGLLHRLLQ